MSEFVLPYTDRNDLAPCLNNGTENTQLLKKTVKTHPNPNIQTHAPMCRYTNA
jgi:hypothetical protein